MSKSSLVVAAMSGQTAAVNSTFFLFLVCLIRGWIVISCVARIPNLFAADSELELAPARRYRHFLLEREIEQGLARHLHLVSLSDDFRSGADPAADARADRRSFAAAREGTDDRPDRRSTDRSLGSARPTRLPGQLILSGCHRHSLSIHHNPGE